jgi:hypothetical protein
MLTHYSLISPGNTNSHKREAEANLHPKTAGLVIFVFNKMIAMSSKKLPVFNKKQDNRKSQMYVSLQQFTATTKLKLTSHQTFFSFFL